MISCSIGLYVMGYGLYMHVCISCLPLLQRTPWGDMQQPRLAVSRLCECVDYRLVLV